MKQKNNKNLLREAQDCLWRSKYFIDLVYLSIKKEIIDKFKLNNDDEEINELFEKFRPIKINKCEEKFDKLFNSIYYKFDYLVKTYGKKEKYNNEILVDSLILLNFSFEILFTIFAILLIKQSYFEFYEMYFKHINFVNKYWYNIKEIAKFRKY